MMKVTASSMSAAAKCRIGCSLALSVASLIVFSMVAKIYFNNDPIYVPILCNSTASSTETMRIPFWRGGGMQFSGSSTMVCQNPNNLIFRVEPEDNWTIVYIVQGNETKEEVAK